MDSKFLKSKKIIFSINGSMGYCGVDEYTLILEKALNDSFDFIHIIKENSDISKLLLKKSKDNSYENRIVLFEKSYFKAAKKIIEACKKIKPDIVIIHTAAEYFLSIFVRLFCNAKIILFRHNSFKLNFFPNYFFIKLAELIVAPSNFCADVIKKQFPEFSSKIKVIYNAINNRKEDNKKIEDIIEDNIQNAVKDGNVKNELKGKNKIILGFIGRITKQKGIELLIDAISELKVLDINMGWELLVGGKFDSIEYQNYIEGKIKSKNLSDKIKFIGFVEDKKKFFDSIDICVVPSLQSWKETFGLVVIESFKYGKPVVASSSGALAEILSYGPAAPICYEENPRSLAVTILTLKDKNIREKYLFNGKILINTLFSFKRFQHQYLKLLNQIM